jgi:type IV secretory pathway VirB3-like protein
MINDAEEWTSDPDFKDGLGVPLEVLVTEGISEWLCKVIKKNPCLAHLLQLAIQNALRDSRFFSTLLNKVKNIINFFSKSPKFTEMLRVRTNGMSLLKIGITRWNSTYDALNRISLLKKRF